MSSKCPHPKRKQQRKTAKNKQRQREDDKAAKAHASKAHKRAINWYAADEEKVNGMGATKISELLKEEFDGVVPSKRTIRVPNTTAVTQETNRNYVPFKTQFRMNLEHVVSSRIDAGVYVSL